jgi:hypothetical protein
MWKGLETSGGIYIKKFQQSQLPINTVGPYKDRFVPLPERSELPQLLLYFSSVFFSLKKQYPWLSFHENFFS